MISSLCGTPQSSGLRSQPQPVNEDDWAGIRSISILKKKNSLIVNPRIRTISFLLHVRPNLKKGNTQLKAAYPDRS